MPPSIYYPHKNVTEDRRRKMEDREDEEDGGRRRRWEKTEEIDKTEDGEDG